MADKMMRMAGRNKAGLAKALTVDTNGIILTHCDSEINVFSKTNPLAPRIAAHYEPRSTGTQSHSFPQLWTPYDAEGFAIRAYRNIFDQSFVISSTLDADLNVKFIICEVASGAEISIALYAIEIGDIPAYNGIGNAHRFVLTPEKSSGLLDANIFEVPELRQPFPAFQLKLTPVTAPTSGEIKILNARRY